MPSASRRQVLAGLTGACISLAAFNQRAMARVADAERIAGGRAAPLLAQDETYWSMIQRAFDAERTLINLNNGGVSPAPTHVLEQMVRDLRFVNELPAVHNWQILEPRMESTRRDVAAEFGCDPEELAIVRNASEGLETMILGIDLQRGDEVIITNQNYGRMVTTWKQRARRDGIVVREVSFPVPLTDPGVLVRTIEAAITPRTRAIELPHITNLTGQVLPIRDIVRLARPHGIQVFVDGAHAFAQLPFKRDDLECDYYAASLHKWLHAPIGSGFLYVRRDRIPALWPLMGADESRTANVRKYEEIGTHPQAVFNAVSVAVAFHRGIGVERKVARLRYLRDRWAKALLARSERVRVPTPLGPDQGGAIGLLSVDGLAPAAFSGWLMDKYRIVTTPIVHPEFSGVRITPSIYTQVQEIDIFIDAASRAIREGIG